MSADKTKLDIMRESVANKILKILEWVGDCNEFEKAK
jgi:hypothetical protein